MMPCVPQVFRTRKLEVQPDRPVYQFMTQQVHCIQYFVPSWRQTLVVAFLKKWIMLGLAGVGGGSAWGGGEDDEEAADAASHGGEGCCKQGD